MQLVIHNWVNFQLHVSHATGNQLHKTIAKCQISSSDLWYPLANPQVDRQMLDA